MPSGSRLGEEPRAYLRERAVENEPRRFKSQISVHDISPSIWFSTPSLLLRAIDQLRVGTLTSMLSGGTFSYMEGLGDI